MIDFNDTAASTKNTPRIVSDAEREELRAELLARLESVLFTLFPAGKKRRGTFLIGDVLGSPGDSLEVVLDGEKAGLWTDRADDSGGDVFALIGYIRLAGRKCSQARAVVGNCEAFFLESFDMAQNAR